MSMLFHIVPISIGRDGFDIQLLVKRLTGQVGTER
jgi:hypothetical protein